jgi:hypothetical protein
VRNLSNLWCARAIEISRFFRDLVLMDASEKSIADFISRSAYERFSSSIYVSNILLRCNLFHRVLNKNFDQWTL